MKFLKQFTIILCLSFLGEVMKEILPLPIPASVYGLMLMFGCLASGILKLSQIKDAALFLIEIMPVMFIPASVGLLDAWPVLQPVFWPIAVTVVATTVIVMLVTGIVTQSVIRKEERKNA